MLQSQMRTGGVEETGGRGGGGGGLGGRHPTFPVEPLAFSHLE